MAGDFFHLSRFVSAQNEVYETVLEELRAGWKRSHWMWFIFPQIAGLGRSPAARRYAIAGLAEAKAYLSHPMLGPRLSECCRLLLMIEGRSTYQIFGTPDDLKLRSSMTLFLRAAPSSGLFRQILDAYFDGQPDPRTVRLLQESGDGRENN